jgi:hypothetical protein
MTLRSSLLAASAAALSLALSASASAAAPDSRPPIIYPLQGIKAVGHDARLFGQAKAKARFWVGKRLDATCSRVSHDSASGPASTDVRSTRFAGTAIRLGATAGKDYCVVTHPTHGLDAEPVAVVALTDAGRAWALEAQGALALIAFPVEDDAAGNVPTVDALLHQFPKDVVALPTPDAPAPAPGKLGYWSDGAHHFVLALSEGTGRRLFLEAEGDGVLRTNVLDYLDALDLL